MGDVTDELLVLDYADEQSVVQTRFATTVLTVARAHIGHDLGPVVEQARAVVAADLDDELVDRPHYVFLGRGWAVGVAREAALKVQEAAAAWSEAYPALEYRHGPLSAADENTVVWLFGVDDDVLVNDIKRTGATVVVDRGRSAGRAGDWRSASRSPPPRRAGSTPTSPGTCPARSVTGRDTGQ